MSIFDKKIIFTEMDKLHRWIVGRDVAWAKQIGVGGFFGVELTLIHLLVKEFIQSIVRSIANVIELVVREVLCYLMKIRW